PIILATLAVIVSFLPMFFITGMMGPYMRPMALNVPLAMLMSMLVAFTITPWMSRHLLKPHNSDDHPETPLTATPIYRLYAAAMRPLLDRRALAWALLAVTAVLFVLACLLPLTGRVPLKMLPFDNKNEFQLVIDMPESATLEATAAVTDELARYLVAVNEVTNLTTYVGHASPMDFNGLVRHHYLRHAPNLAEIRVNLLEKRSRAQQSHEIILRLRDDLTAIARRHSAKLQLVEQPPGPPVIATLTAELYGPDTASYADLQAVARRVEARFNQQPGVVDVDSTVEDPVTRLSFQTDDEKANLAGLSDMQIAADLQSWLSGATPTYLHNPRELAPLPVILRLPEPQRSSVDALLNLYLPTTSGTPIQLRELGRFDTTTYDPTIYHKNLRPLAYIFAENAGIAPVDAILAMHTDLQPGSTTAGPIVPGGFNLVWTGEGEWKITVDAFRDLGLAFAAACLGIYILLVYETNSYAMPLILMVSIPLTILGIMPGFWLLNLLLNHPIAGYANPVFFTATAMIGMIALAGIAVRNAILLIDFIHAAQREGQSLRDAILQSGAVRFRPILLTAGTALLAAWPITLDPIFSGLAWALIFGLFVSTAFTLLVIPTIYWLIYHHRPTATI
ncbi:MAG: efflux RND transporter permease subunit, partial [Phycisphaeraceae bacterium]|nr:efflux RND transporter permease subunit [Phycisphaeraceae bacterium]